MIFLRSFLFTLWFAAITLVMGVLALPLLLGRCASRPSGRAPRCGA